MNEKTTIASRAATRVLSAAVLAGLCCSVSSQESAREVDPSSWESDDRIVWIRQLVNRISEELESGSLAVDSKDFGWKTPECRSKSVGFHPIATRLLARDGLGTVRYFREEQIVTHGELFQSERYFDEDGNFRYARTVVLGFGYDR